jgi:tRNA (cytidine/uridine-2'-O-)-methyltransferase
MFQVILYEPEIPPNTGNVMRLCANLGARLHLVEPLGFRLEDRLLRRAGLDYREWADVRLHPHIESCRGALGAGAVYALSTRGRRCYAEPQYHAGDAFLFGPETRGLPRHLVAALPPERLLRIPMQPGNRSLNLSNAVAVVLFEAWRQNGFRGASMPYREASLADPRRSNLKGF